MTAAVRGRFTSSGSLLAANIVEVLVPFVRNIVLARLIAPQDFGLAVSMSVVTGMIEVLTDLGLPLFAVGRMTILSQARTLATLQSIALLRATVLALILLAISPLMASAFHAPPGSRGAYSMLAVIALIRGFENFGIKEVMRHLVFWREALALGASQSVGLAVTCAIAAIKGGFTCMIWGMMAASVTLVVLSHLLSPRPWRLGWDAVAVKEVAIFSRPLLVNGAAVTCALSDRLFVGAILGPSLLAIYNVAYGTATLPRSVLAKFLTNAFLPLFAREQGKPGKASNLCDTWAWCLSIIGFVYGFSLCLLGDRAIGLVFGPAYHPSRLFMCLAGLSVCVKFLMLLPVPAAYASGTTRTIAFGSILSAVSILPGAALLLWRRDVSAYLAGVTITEIFALIVFSRHSMIELSFTRSATWLAIGAPILLIATLSGLSSILPDMAFNYWAETCAAVFGLAAIFYSAMILKFQVAANARGMRKSEIVERDAPPNLHESIGLHASASQTPD